MPLTPATAATPFDPTVTAPFSQITPPPRGTQSRYSRSVALPRAPQYPPGPDQINNGHGQAGILYNDPTAQVVYSNLSVYPTLQLQIPPGQANGDSNTFYGPTMKTVGSCAEFPSIDYWTVGTSTLSALRVYNFCDGVGWNTGVATPFDASFSQAYIRDLGRGIPQVTAINAYRPGYGAIGILFNYATNGWDVFYRYPDSSTPRTDGWLLDAEFWWVNSPCGTLPAITASEISFNGTLVTTGNVQAVQGGACSVQTTFTYDPISTLIVTAP